MLQRRLRAHARGCDARVVLVVVVDEVLGGARVMEKNGK